MKSILLTGAFGYVGKRLAVFLGEQGHSVRMASRQQRNNSQVAFRNCALQQMNFEDKDSLDKACAGVDVVLHLAGPNEIEAAEAYADNLASFGAGTVRLMEAAVRQKVGRVIYFSTAHVYGAPLTGHISEDRIAKPGHPYSAINLIGETIVRGFQRKGTLDTVVVRLSNGYGAPVTADMNRWTLLVNDLCLQAVRQKKLVLKSTGLQYRDFVTLDDVCRATQHLMLAPSDVVSGELYNLGGDDSISVYEMTTRIAQRCEAVFGYRPEIERPAPGPSETAPTLDFDTSKLKKTGFTLNRNFAQAIDETLRLCAQNLV